MEDRNRAAERCEDRKAASARLRRLDDQLHAARRAEEAMPLTRYYGPRPLRAIPLAQLLDEGWCAA
jgi:hypothetical protein